MVNPSEIPPEVWIYGSHMDFTWEGLPRLFRMRRWLLLFQGKAVFMALSLLTSSTPTESFVKGVGREEKACSLLLTFLDTDSLRPPPLEQQSCVKCQEELCSWAPWPQSLCGLRFLPSVLCSSDGNQRVQLEDNLLVPDLILGSLLA